MVRPTTPGAALILGERVLSRCDAGALAVEYMLFDSGEVLVASEGLSVREHGYLTTAASARDRLDRAGASLALGQACLAALRPGHLRALARSPVVLDVVERLTPYEAFEGGRFDPESGRYDGVWLDLDALARACPLPAAALLFQALHLRAALEEARGDAAVRMSTAKLTEGRKPNERTWTRTSFENASRLPDILARMRVPARSPRAEAVDAAEVREELLRNLRLRSASAETTDPRLHSLARRLAAPRGEAARPPSRPPSPDFIVTDPDPLPTDLRRHADMLRGEGDLQAVAKFLSAMAERGRSQPELAALAARAWLAAGEKGHARFFARRLVDDASAPDEVRLMAFEMLESTAPTQQSQMPPPIDATEPAPIVPKPILVPKAPAPSVPPLAASATALPLVTRQPPAVIVETMPLPAGLDDAALGPGDPVTTPVQAHVATTRLARALARDYRLAYGTTLKTDPVAIEAMQRQIRRRLGEAPPEKELLRHGALFAEILVRSLGAKWDDVSGEPAAWVMIVPPSARVTPIGRVVRYFERGRRESDLVAWFFELEKKARGR